MWWSMSRVIPAREVLASAFDVFDALDRGGVRNTIFVQLFTIPHFQAASWSNVLRNILRGSQLCYIAEGLNFFLLPLRPHSIKSTILTCILHIAYHPRQHKSTEFRCTFSYLTCSRKRLDTNCATKRMPHSQIVLCTAPHMQFALQRALVSVLRIV
jgi:hypothetical protein